MALFIALEQSERRHEFATMARFGARLRKSPLRLSEAALVLAAMRAARGRAWLAGYLRELMRCSITR